jgi:hypothetical protein
MIREFEQARLLALKKGQASAAVTATMAKAKLAGLLKERPESNPESAEKFDGNYTEAARRIALLLRLAADETASEQKLDGLSGQDRCAPEGYRTGGAG